MLKRRKSFALTLTAAAVPAFGLCPSLGWAGALLGGAAAAWILNRTERALRGRSLAKAAACGAVGRAAAAVSALGLFGLALWAAGRSRLAFPETAGSPLAAALIFALSFWAARSGAEAVGRCAAVLLPLLAVLYGVILVFSLSQLRLSWLLPTGTPRAGLRACVSLLLPGAALFLRREDGVSVSRGTAIAALAAAAAAAVTAGTLSPPGAAARAAFLTVSRSVSILGVIQRFEALISGAMLMSGFCLCTLLLLAARELLDSLAPKKSSAAVKTSAFAAGLIFLWLPTPETFRLTGVTAICGGVACAFLLFVVSKNKSQKNEENA